MAVEDEPSGWLLVEEAGMEAESRARRSLMVSVGVMVEIVKGLVGSGGGDRGGVAQGVEPLEEYGE